MAFEAYKPGTRSKNVPIVSLTKTYLGFNLLACKFINDWKEVILAYDKDTGCFALRKGGIQYPGQKISETKDKMKTIASAGFVRFFEIQKLIGTKYTIEDKKDYLMLTPIGKGADVPVVPENKTNKICFCKKCGHTENSWKDKRPDKCPKCGSTTFEETIMRKKLEV
jgi:hypothetical protein